MLYFLFTFFLRISETLKAPISEMEAETTNSKKPSSQVLTVFHISLNKKIIKNYDA